MAENGPHGHQGGGAASDDGHTAPPTTIAFSLTSGAGPYGGTGGGSSSSATGKGNMENMDAGGVGMGKQKLNLIPDLNMEGHDDDSAGGSKDDLPLWEAEMEVEVAAPAADADAADKGKNAAAAEVEVAAADADAADKGKNAAAAADDGEPNVHIMLERERRKKMKDLFGALRDLMPHVPKKSDKVTIVGEAIDYIETLEKEAAKLEMKKQARQATAAAAARGKGKAAAASVSPFSLTAMPQTAQGMAALSAGSGVVPLPRGGGVLQPVAPPPAAPSPAAAAASPPVRSRTWSAPNVVLTVANDSAYISVCAARRPNANNTNTLAMVTSVLQNHGIDVVTVQVSADRVRSIFLINAHLSGTEGANTSSEQVYQRAVSEIRLRLNSNS